MTNLPVKRAIDALLQDPSRAKAAELAGVSSVALWRLRKKPALGEALNAARLEAHWQSLGTLQRACHRVTRKLVRIGWERAARKKECALLPGDCR